MQGYDDPTGRLVVVPFSPNGNEDIAQFQVTVGEWYRCRRGLSLPVRGEQPDPELLALFWDINLAGAVLAFFTTMRKGFG